MHFVVTTTINKPTFIEEYIRDFKRFGHDYLFVIAGDLKTPSSVKDYCDGLEGVVYLDVNEQKKMFGRLALYKYIPFNSIGRRNLGYLYCLAKQYTEHDVIITIDDDNWLKQEDFIGHHSRRRGKGTVIQARQPTWYNPLKKFYREKIFFRGFSPFHRNDTTARIKEVNGTYDIAVNQGLWEENPDVDALERLMGLKGDYKVRRKRSIILASNMLCPCDTQNTAFLNGFGLTAFLCPYVGRYDDIFSSLITKRIADYFRFGVAYGAPVVRQRRNPHNNWNDFLEEIHGMAVVDKLADVLWEINIKADGLAQALEQVGQQLRRLVTIPPLPMGRGKRKWDIRQLGEGIGFWLDALERLGIEEIKPR